MSTVIIMLGGESFRSYATVAQANAYLAADPTAAGPWAVLSDDDKARRLIAASRRLDLLPWAGKRAIGDQALEWPRTGLRDAAGAPVRADDVPAEIATATILLAGDPASVVSTVATDDDAEIESEMIGPKQASYWHRRRGRVERIIGHNPAVLSLVRQWLRSAAPPAGAVVSGGTTESAFYPPYRSGRPARCD